MKNANFAPKLLGLGVISAAVLAACGGGGGGAAPSSSAAIISGTAAKGIVSGATVTAYCWAASGAQAVSSVIGTATTDSNGNYSITPSTTCSTPVQLVMTIPASGAYVYDEVTGQNSQVQAGALTLNAILSSSASTNNAQITPFTDMAATVVENTISNAIAAGSSPLAVLNQTVVTQAVAAVQSQVFPSNPNLYYTQPLNPATAASSTSANATNEQQLAGLLTAIAARAHNTHSGDFQQAIQELDDAAKNSIQISTISGNVTTNITAPAGQSTPTAIMNEAINSDVASVSFASSPEATDAKDLADTHAKGIVPASAPVVSSSAPVAVPSGLAAAKSLISSLRTNLQMLHNSSNTGFMDTEYAAMKTSFTGFKSTAKQTSDFINIVGTAKHMLQNSSIPSPQYTGNGMCSVSSGVATCEWGWHTGSTGVTYHVTNFGSYTNTSGNESMTWSDQLQSFTYGSTGMQPAGSTQAGTVTTTSTSSTSKTVDITGMLGALDPTADHSSIGIEGVLTKGTSQDTLTLSNKSVGTTSPIQGGVVDYDSSGNTLFSLSFDQTQGNSIVYATPATATTTAQPTSVAFYVMAKSNAPSPATNFEFDGSIQVSGVTTDMSGTLHDAKSVTFNGSVTDLGNSTIGKFLTGSLTHTIDLSHYDVTNHVIGSGNYKIEGLSFQGNLTAQVNGAAQAFSISAANDYVNTPYGTDNLQFTYKDPSNTVTVSVVPGANGGKPSILATSNGVTFSLAPDGSGSLSDTSTGTQYGVITNNIVNYGDGTTESLR